MRDTFMCRFALQSNLPQIDVTPWIVVPDNTGRKKGYCILGDQSCSSISMRDTFMCRFALQFNLPQIDVTQSIQAEKSQGSGLFFRGLDPDPGQLHPDSQS